jgi:hypothetical protein
MARCWSQRERLRCSPIWDKVVGAGYMGSRHGIYRFDPRRLIIDGRMTRVVLSVRMKCWRQRERLRCSPIWDEVVGAGNMGSRHGIHRFEPRKSDADASAERVVLSVRMKCWRQRERLRCSPIWDEVVGAGYMGSRHGIHRFEEHDSASMRLRNPSQRARAKLSSVSRFRSS